MLKNFFDMFLWFLKIPRDFLSQKNLSAKTAIFFKTIWRSRDLNPGLSACEADTLPLSYTPTYESIVISH